MIVDLQHHFAPRELIKNSRFAHRIRN